MNNIEIERKFLVNWDVKNLIKFAKNTIHIKQGYLSTDPNNTIRIRIENDHALLTIKGRSNESGLSRSEWEFPIDSEYAQRRLKSEKVKLIEKTRYWIENGLHIFELDVFHGDNEGLVIAEVELASEDEQFAMPVWAGEEVTGINKYYNSNLIDKPFSKW